MLDFAVNVRATEPPSWLVDRLAALIAPSFTGPEAALAAAGARPDWPVQVDAIAESLR
jgi:histidinol-phosphate aminotransferase